MNATNASVDTGFYFRAPNSVAEDTKIGRERIGSSVGGKCERNYDEKCHEKHDEKYRKT